LSPHGVQLSIERGMAAGAPRRADLLDSAFGVYVERIESLWAAFYPEAVRGNVKAAEVCRRLLAQMGDLYGLVQRGRVPDEFPPVAPGGPDALAEWRANRLKRPS